MAAEQEKTFNSAYPGSMLWWLDDDIDLCRQMVSRLRSSGWQVRTFHRPEQMLAALQDGRPDLLVLDEPTVGLDPYQIRQVRELITQLADRHTILLSTHILSEVEMTCDQAIIINRGKVALAGPLEDLRSKNQTLEEMFIKLVDREESALAGG